MKKNVPAYISYPLLFTLCGLLLTNVPIVGMLMLLPFVPLLDVTDQLLYPLTSGTFSQTGHHVDIDTFGIELKTWQAWVFYGVHYFVIGLIVGVILHLRRRPKNAIPPAR